MKGRAQRKGEKPARERRRWPVGEDPRRERRREGANARRAPTERCPQCEHVSAAPLLAAWEASYQHAPDCTYDPKEVR